MGLLRRLLYQSNPDLARLEELHRKQPFVDGYTKPKEQLLKLAWTWGIRVERVWYVFDLGKMGTFYPRDSRITIRRTLKEARYTTVLCHELLHALARRINIAYLFSGDDEEIIVDLATARLFQSYFGIHDPHMLEVHTLYTSIYYASSKREQAHRPFEVYADFSDLLARRMIDELERI